MKIVAANWKMNKGVKETDEFFKEYGALVKGKKITNKVIICPSFTSIAAALEWGKKNGVSIGAQNVHNAASGTFTGEINAAMLKETGIAYVIVGHSDRRAMNGETDELVGEKVRAVVAAGMIPILCCGENLSERQKNKSEEVVKKQLLACLSGLDKSAKLIIAYEPIWAISKGDGVGPVATDEMISQMHQMIKEFVADVFVGVAPPLLYGGSVNEKNAKEVGSIEGVDGFLVGGAALCPKRFSGIVLS